MIPVTFNGIHRYYLVKEPIGGCIGCCFEFQKTKPCSTLVGQVPTRHRCGNFNGIYIATDEESVAAYVALRLEST